jgi:hypothetical protein
MRAPARIVSEINPAKRYRQARTDVISERDCPQVMLACGAELLSERESRRDDRRSGVRLRWAMRIVRFIRMGEDAIHERGVNGARRDVRAEHRRHRTAGLRARERECRLARRQLGTGNHRREGIQDVMLRLFDNLSWQHAIFRRRHIAAQRRHHGADRLRAKADRRQRRGAERQRTSIEQLAARHAARSVQSKYPESMYRSHSVPTTLMLSCVKR